MKGYGPEIKKHTRETEKLAILSKIKNYNTCSYITAMICFLQCVEFPILPVQRRW